ncbi:hypothetical protein [Hymenobacter sp.]|jgi:hypothetical protein|uniref:hypothetical protein n=1 Tax=Hymenobacter sp. TaxID=1898978 RepID=UPI002ED8DA7D
MSEQKITGPYYVSSDPAAPYKTLYYELPEAVMVERITNVERVGYTNDFIFAESEGNFYYIIRAKDIPSYLGDPRVEAAISRPLSEVQFLNVLDSLRLKNFSFQYSAI